MAGASKSKKWSEDQVTRLLAWLDYCLLHEIDFKSTVVQHLKEKAQKEVHLGQVHAKLKREWLNLGRGDSKNVNDLYQEGTSCLVELDQEEREAIRQAIVALGVPPVKYRIRGASSVCQSPSRTLSIGRRKSSSSTLSIVPTIATTEVGSQNPWRDLAASHIESSDASDPSIRSEVHSVHSKAARWIAPDSRPQIEGDDSDSPAPLLLQVNSLRQYIPETQEDIPNVKTENRGETRSIPSSLRTTAVVDARDNQLDLLERELRTSKSKVGELRGEIFALNRRLVTARLERDNGRPWVPSAALGRDIDAIAILRSEHSKLRNELIAMQGMKEDLVQLSAIGLGPSDTQIQSECDLIESGIADACSSLSAYNLMQEGIGSFSASEHDVSILSTWTRRISGYDIGPFLLRCSEAGVYEVDLLRAVVAAIICSLVFDTPFSELMSVESPILEYYRKHISICCG
jgi:hypothetical protein